MVNGLLNGFPKSWGYSKNEGFMRGNPIQMDDFEGTPYFRKIPDIRTQEDGRKNERKTENKHCERGPGSVPTFPCHPKSNYSYKSPHFWPKSPLACRSSPAPAANVSAAPKTARAAADCFSFGQRRISNMFMSPTAGSAARTAALSERDWCTWPRSSHRPVPYNVKMGAMCWMGERISSSKNVNASGTAPWSRRHRISHGNSSGSSGIWLDHY